MHSSSEANFEKVKVVLLDIAGTTTSLEFVKEKLFAFINEETAAFLKKNTEDEAVKKALEGIKEKDKELDTDAAVELIKKLTNDNSENASLKTLQGLISKEGYQNGTLKAHVFDDVRAAFESWSADKKIAIYSTGDKESQKLLFEHTIEGNLTAHISNYFDQSTGSKNEPETYTKILEELKVAKDEVLFINDNAEELTAAKKSGLLTALIKREGNAAIDEEISKEFSTTVSSFSDLSFEVSNKRKKEDNTDEIEVPPPKIPKTEEKIVDEPKTKLEEPEKTEVTTKAKDDTTEKPTESPCEAEPMEVDSVGKEKEAEEKKPAEAAPEVSSMETEEIKPSETAIAEVSTTEPQKTEVGENKSKVEEKKIEVEVVEKKTIETETKTGNSENLDKVDNEAVAATNEEDVKKESVEVVADKLSCEASADKKVETVTQVKDVAETQADSSADVKPEKVVTESGDVSTSKSVDDEPSSSETDAKVKTEPSNTNHVQSDNKDGAKTKASEEPLADKKDAVAETKVQEENKESVVEKPLDKVVNEEKIEETNKDDTKKSDNTNAISTGDETKTVVEDKNGVSQTHENGSKNEEKTIETKSNEDATNGVSNGQENGDKSTGAKEDEEETEIKVKKIETNEGSPAVAVEV